MPENIWKKIVDDTRHMSITYRPFLLNEPFTDYRMLEISRYISQDPTARIEFNTNGELLGKGLSEALLDTSVSAIRFSIDGFTADTVKKARGLDLEKIKRNILDLIDLKNKKGSDILIEARMINFPGTEDEQKLFSEYWAQQGITPVITQLYSYPWEKEMEPVMKPCLKIRDEMFFTVDGMATLCCWDTFQYGTVGNVAEKDVLSIWNGDAMKTYRRLLEKGQRDKIKLCSRCDAYKDLPDNAFQYKEKTGETGKTQEQII